MCQTNDSKTKIVDKFKQSFENTIDETTDRNILHVVLYYE